MLTDAELADIAARASTLEERLNGEVLLDDPADDDPLVNARLERWKQVVANGDEALFAKRLAWDNLDMATVRRALGRPRWPEGKALPEWAGVLREAVLETRGISQSLKRKHAEAETGRVEAAAPIPFEEILLPFVRVGGRRLDIALAAVQERRQQTAAVAMERDLLTQLSRLAGEAIWQKWSYARLLGSMLPRRRTKRSRRSADRFFYDLFVQSALESGSVILFQEYPVLARLLAQSVQQWVNAASEIFLSLSSDLVRIRKMLGLKGKRIRIAAAKLGLSDPHQGGRTVAMLALTTGDNLVYKPRSLALDLAWFQLLNWVNRHLGLKKLRCLHVLDRGDYGWMEFARQAPCQSKTEVCDYFYRAGMLLAILHALGATDCHHENVVATQTEPVLVDLESILQPEASPSALKDSRTSAYEVAQDELRHSVLGTGFLPRPVVDAGRMAWDASGLAGAGHQILGILRPEWTNANTDGMTMSFEPLQVPDSLNRVALGKHPIRCADYQAQVGDGFTEMGRLLIGCREELLALGGPLDSLAAGPMRVFHRSTAAYAKAIVHTRRPAFLQDGADRSLALESLAQRWLENGSPEGAGEIWKIEHSALERGDIPYFPIGNCAKAAGDDRRTTTTAFRNSGVRNARARIHSMSAASLDRQVDILRAALANGDCEIQMASSRDSLGNSKRGAKTVGSSVVWSAQAGVAKPEAFPAGWERHLLLQAFRLGDVIERNAIWAPDGTATWIGLSSDGRPGGWRLQALGPYLYDGVAGVALFVSALFRVSQEERYRGLALAALRPLRDAVQQHGVISAAFPGIGGAVGLGSLLYTFTLASSLLGEPELIEDARQTAALISPTRILDDPRLDVVSGCAGALLSLLALHEVCADPAVLERALLCGERLLGASICSHLGSVSWPTYGNVALAGFAHGASGIVTALLRLYKCVQNQKLLTAALCGIAYENSLFVPAQGNWRDLRQHPMGGSAPPFKTAWCHGAPGIVLSRIEAVGVIDIENLKAELEVALTTTSAMTLEAQDHLCCGNLGRVEVLLTAGERLGRRELLQRGLQHALMVSGRSIHLGTFGTPVRASEAMSPGFYTGISGVGYTLLRLARPDELPSILDWSGSTKSQNAIAQMMSGSAYADS